MKTVIKNNPKLVEEILKRKIGFLGLGQIGSVLLKSFSNHLNDHYSDQFKVNFKDYFYLYDPNINKKDEYGSLGYANFMKDEHEVFQSTRILFSCVKPDNVYDLCTKSKNNIDKNSMIVSIAAGINIEYMEHLYKSMDTEVPKIVRVMTNHLCAINQGGSVYSMNKKCDNTDEEIINTLLSNVGIVKKIDENLMNAYTALTGSGPAFVYHFIESLVDSALKNGIDLVSARQFAIQNVMGAAMFMHESKDKNPNNIQYIVATPKGTTIAGLNQLNKHRFKYTVDQAITTATKRGMEIEEEKMKFLLRNKNKI